ncbi:MAG: hypothetical protein QOF89_4528 [Acidobacteriota bacterium]|jgi:hypothetical protein|nr:hypothetical protein [Acidobacteriota bacterium]
MSLISDALKKARQEAARQDSLRQGAPYAVGAADLPDRRRTLIPVLAGLGAGCLLAAALFLGAYLGGRGPFQKPAKETVQVAEATPPAVTPAPTPAVAATPAPPPVVEPVLEEKSQPVVPTPTPAPPVIPPPRPQERTVPVQTAPPPVAETPARVEPTPAPAAPIEEPRPVAPPVLMPAVPTPVPAPASNAGALEDGKSYVSEVPVPGGGVVRLNGIAYSPEHPIAVLDGRVMGPGEVVQGFTVIEIQAGHVKLQGHGATVFVTTK